MCMIYLSPEVKSNFVNIKKQNMMIINQINFDLKKNLLLFFFVMFLANYHAGVINHIVDINQHQINSAKFI